MISNIKKQFMLRKKDFLDMAGIFAGIWAVFFLVTCVVLVLDTKPSNTYANLGVVFSLIFGAMFYLLSQTTGFLACFDMAVRMSASRKGVLISYSLITLVFNAGYSLLLYAIYIVDLFLARLFFPSLDFVKNVFVMDFKFVALIFGGLCVLYLIGLFMSALLSQFGKKAFWFIWGLYMFLILFSSAIGRFVQTQDTSTVIGKIVNSIASFFISLGGSSLIILGALALLATTCYAVLYLRKAAVKL